MSKCLLCEKELSGIPLMKCSNMPASAQNIPSSDELADETGISLDLYQCPHCGLVQFECEPVSYYRDVIRSGGFSTTMVELRRKQYRHLIETYRLEGKKFIEVGCGQGEFLQVLTEFPVDAYGIEHKADLVTIARSKGLNVTRQFTDTADTVIAGAPFDVFLSFNFIEHQPDPNTMMECIYNNLSEDGCGLVTVPSFEYILENDSFYELLRDHIANYTRDSLRFLMEKNGFEVLECELINRDTWAVIVRKRQRADVSGLAANFHTLKKQMNDYISKRVNAGKKIAVWGASHQGFTAISTANIGGSIQYIIDSAPFKQGKYSPASHVRIVSPDYFFEEPVDCILIVAPGYTDEIKSIIRRRYGTQVEIAVLMSAAIEEGH